MKIEGHSALVTGGASGLGEATARALSAAGARVAILDHNIEGARRVASELGGLALQCDVSSADSAEAAVAEAASRHGPARILINCAGVAPAQKILSRNGLMPLADFRRAIEINLVGTFNILRLFADAAAKLEPLEGGERGVVVNTASVAGYEGQIGQTAYASSKAGVIGLTLPAARELAQVGIRVCAEVIDLTLAGGIFVPASSVLAVRQILEAKTEIERPLAGLFTLRQAEVVDALRRGKANKIIAYELNLRESTVKVHIRNIMKKLKATNRTEVAFKLKDLFPPENPAS